MNSLRRRLLTPLSLAILVVLILSGLGQAWLGERLMHDLVTSRMADEAETLLSATSWSADGQMQVAMDKLSAVYQRPLSGHYYQLSDGQQQLRSRSLWDQQLAQPQGNEIEVAGPLQQRLLILGFHYQKQGHNLQILLAEDMTPHYAPMRAYYLGFALVVVGLMVFLLWLQSWIIRVQLRPLDAVAAAVADLKQGELQRLGEAVPAEIVPLVREVNHLTDLLQQRIERSRHALGNLSHALKTPLALLQQLAEASLWSDYPQQQQTLLQQLQLIHRRVDEELRRARIVGASHPAAGFNPAQQLPLLLETIQRVHADKDIRVQTQLPDDHIAKLSRDDMLELLGNLLDNAFKWATDQVRCEMVIKDSLQILIEDDGPGVEDAQRLLQRGYRLDEQVSGHGLGLAICQEIVQAYQGQIKLGRSESLGGLRVEVILPCT